MSNPQTFSWTPNTQNDDGSPIVAGEITGYNLGVRPAAGSPGVYTINVPVSGTTEPVAAIPSLAPGDYFAAVQSVGPVNSDFTAELPFTVSLPKPLPPTGFTVG